MMNESATSAFGTTEPVSDSTNSSDYLLSNEIRPFLMGLATTWIVVHQLGGVKFRPTVDELLNAIHWNRFPPGVYDRDEVVKDAIKDWEEYRHREFGDEPEQSDDSTFECHLPDMASSEMDLTTQQRRKILVLLDKIVKNRELLGHNRYSQVVESESEDSYAFVSMHKLSPQVLTVLNIISDQLNIGSYSYNGITSLIDNGGLIYEDDLEQFTRHIIDDKKRGKAKNNLIYQTKQTLERNTQNKMSIERAYIIRPQ